MRLALVYSSSSTANLSESMNGCYHYLLLLSVLTSLEKINSISLAPNVTIQHVCEHQLLTIQCSHVNETIDIIRSMYGRTSQRICNSHLQVFYKTCANIEQSKQQTRLRCQGQSTCAILVDNTIYTDPCGSTIPKHFEVHYRCLDVNRICSKSFTHCLNTKNITCVDDVHENYSCQCPPSICQYDSENRIIGFIEQTCPLESFQGVLWPKTLANKGQQMPCPYPCAGQIFRFCQINNQWDKPNYTDCKCPTTKSTRFSMPNNIFQCDFWLINRLLSEETHCFSEKDYEYNGPDTCLLKAFETMTFSSCTSFSFDFQNLAFDVFIPKTNQSHFRLSTMPSPAISNQIIVDRSLTFSRHLPMMFIDMKTINSSLILVEQSIDSTSKQTANVTVVFFHPSAELRYQCRAYRSSNSSSSSTHQYDSSEIFFACQLLCSNGSHVICQCPFYNPSMHYVLHLDTSIPADDFELVMIDNDLKDQCSIDHPNRSNDKLDGYLNKLPLFPQKTNLAKTLLAFLDTTIDNDEQWFNENLHWRWTKFGRLIAQIEFIGLQLMDTSRSFTWIDSHIELFVNTQQTANQDRTVVFAIDNDVVVDTAFFIISKFDEYLNVNQSSNLLNSLVLNLNMRTTPNEQIQITFQHINPLNDSHQLSTCVHLQNGTQWSTDGCYLLSSNVTHSVCSCNHLSTFAVLLDFQEIIEKAVINRWTLLTKTACLISIVCLILTIIAMIMRYRLDTNDDLQIVRTILHVNMCICLLIAQCLYLFSLHQIRYNFTCRVIVILLHYFLLATFSWMFVDGIELIIALKHIFKIDRIRIFAYSLYAYGFPLLIVVFAVSLSNQGYHSNQNCWFSYESALIWAFAIPLVLLIFANIGFFILSICLICRHLKSSNSSQEIRFSLRNIAMISILFGLTWFIGLFHLHDRSPRLFSHLFQILNSLQGSFIFLYYCLFTHKQIDRFTKLCQKPVKEEKVNQHYNTSSSAYSSTHSSDINKQILSVDHQPSFRSNAEYLSSMPSGLLSTFRYPSSNLSIPLTPEQNEQLLKRYKLDTHHPHDDHQYYEIG